MEYYQVGGGSAAMYSPLTPSLMYLNTTRP
jgi:hypothetical protein